MPCTAHDNWPCRHVVRQRCKTGEPQGFRLQSRGGTADAALKLFEIDDALRDLLWRAVDATHRRAQEVRQSSGGTV